MLYNLLFNHFQSFSIDFTLIRAVLAVLSSTIICLVLGPCCIKILKLYQKTGQPIREDGPSSHLSKAGTPTMGGIIIIFSSIISCLFVTNLRNPYIWTILLVMISFAFIGFLDDYKKIRKNHHGGISALKKLLLQSLISVVAIYLIYYYSDAKDNFSALSIPFFDVTFDIKYFYIFFATFVVVGSSNAVNLTDGLDGLAASTVAIATFSFGIIAYFISNDPYVSSVSIAEVGVLCGAIAGGCIGFLYFNRNPAKIFMGDTGSLSLGGCLGLISIITKQELLLVIIGAVFVIETLSVIIQVTYFRYTGGKRIFLMAPLHHHFEQKGLSELKILTYFCSIALIFSIIGLLSLKYI
ncbi:MAG TPA: phospho-N-acetylmuramoyl-pentapeptide-transferase [Candidatus Megaira endosymbiont of Nemacystus decipiens]|nr:phospho-N-acetylmuramoyl-pentapeptide-transferase [Candidatus Megaera endosymbiont of Nemacystus decipiens]